MTFLSRVAYSVCAVLCFSASANVPLHEPDSATRERIEAHNHAQRPDPSDAPENVARPFAEYETARFVLMSGEDGMESKTVKAEIARNLPDGVDFVFLARNGFPTLSQMQQSLAPYLSEDRIHRIDVSTSGNGLWARDGIPVPVFMEDQSLGVVDARYYHHYEPDTFVAKAFNVPLLSHTYYYEGGNFLADARGNCLLVSRDIPNTVFERYYGCKTITKLPHLAGIGHVDERVKLLSDTLALTDRIEYKTALEGLGYTVHLLPNPAGRYETYVNSLLVNGTIFVPTYNEVTDAAAIAKYEEFGLKVVPIVTKNLSNMGHGSIHCITMTYPEATLEELQLTLDGSGNRSK
ncbi:MAG: agmatine deiminase family protein [Bdellovibrionales bacterium]|nr:agmatine deiminase family protein [Bdellovibrionales bacterium]